MPSIDMSNSTEPNSTSGLQYPPGFLSSLPILLSRPAPFAPIRALTAAQFAEIHRLHALADEDQLGDSVLFPFLHGIEGNNLSQNTFFANAARGGVPTYSHPLLPPVNPIAKVPAFRGLVWVRADEHDGPVSPPNGKLGRNGNGYDDDEDMDMEDSDNDEYSDNSAEDNAMRNHSQEGSDNGRRSRVAITIPGRPARSPSISNSTSSSEAAFSPSTAPTSLPTSPSSAQGQSKLFSAVHSHLLTSTLRQNDLLVTCPDGPAFAPARVPEGISLRNFGIQVSIYATLSDVVIYAPNGMTRSAFALAERFKHAIEAKARERERITKTNVVHYNVFVVTDTFSEFETHFPHLVAWDSKGNSINYVDFAVRERVEMCNLTQATEVCDGVWLGNSNDVPTYQPDLPGNDPFANAAENNPFGFDICVECCDGAQFPSSIELACAEGHIRKLDELWNMRQQRETNGEEISPRPAPSANHVLHLAFPSSPPSNQYTVNHVLSFISFLQSLLYPDHSSSLPSSSSMFTGSPPTYGSPSSYSGSSSFSSGVLSSRHRDSSAGSTRTSGTATPIMRKCRILLFSSDGYTETSILALCLLMAPKPSHYVNPQHSALSVFGTTVTNSPRLQPTHPQSTIQRSNSASAIAKTYVPNGSTTTGMSLPDAYLELQISRGRSFYVYPTDLDLLKRVEARLYTAPREIPKERGRDREIVARSISVDGTNNGDTSPTGGSGFSKWKWSTWGSRASFSIPSPPVEEDEAPQSTSGAAAMLIPMLSSSTPSASLISGSSVRASTAAPRRRARASTSPMPHVWADHWAWFSDPRFDGSFPSRVLPFLYLGNLAHASNAYMLHALGITHVVSVGECALVPPQANCSQAAEYRFSYGGKVLGAGPGSLWIEEREGRIKVLDIKGVSDDGIDSLRVRFREVCDWIEAARLEGGKVLVHCRVGVSRSATVTIAYVMKHLGVSLVDAYLLVRSRRLSVLIQPNLRLLYNLCSWEAELAQELAQSDPDAVNAFLGRRLSWPYLSREVHLLNEKYIQ
ncbi:hypothetical protein M408DRAFT_325977 [Serendipita vermifera MAFF 305830]|uniref:Uncharacterized protein n=1 Tax=Serendipita vermifera MAFF 305830 TaxID=933852 RepID=A0A0C3B8N9_SERVB|nr:hypothetical protein M408DRAFT_325977 [Serendipita vermifera MAFF 305830]